MSAMSRLIELALARPGDALVDVLGLAAICAIIFVGFAATTLA